MDRHLLDIAIRPYRMAFLLGGEPSIRLVHSVLAINSGLWGGVHNLICTTDGRSVPISFVHLLQHNKPDVIVFCGNFQGKTAIINQLESNDIKPILWIKKITIDDLEKFGIGLEGILDAWFTQLSQRTFLPEIGIIDTKKGTTSLIDKFKYGIPPRRIIKYCEFRADFISTTRYYKENEKPKSSFDKLTTLTQLTAESIERVVRLPGRALPTGGSYLLRQRIIVIGTENSLEDSCYFWNLRASFGQDNVYWLPVKEVLHQLRRQGSIKSIRMFGARYIILTSFSQEIEKQIKGLLSKRKGIQRQFRYRTSTDILRVLPRVHFLSERRTEHMVSQDNMIIVPASMPRSFAIEYPKISPKWIMDLRIVRDGSLGTEGLIIPYRTTCCDLLAPKSNGTPQLKIDDDIFSFGVTSRTQHIKFKMPTSWEVIGAITKTNYPNIALSDQGRYMNRVLSLFSGLPDLYDILSNEKVRVVLDEFMKHHRTGEKIADKRYRRTLTYEKMVDVLLAKIGSRSRRVKEESLIFLDQTIKYLIKIGAIHSGFQLSCSNCNLDDWYPIDEVSEHFRCRRCLSTEVRPINPMISFRLNEALYQAYSNDFVVPVLTLGLLRGSSKGSFIFCPQINLDGSNIKSPEMDIMCLVDGKIIIGESKSINKIKKTAVNMIGSIAEQIGARLIVFATTNKSSCVGTECLSCIKNEDYADNAFSQGSPDSADQFGTREYIKNLRARLLLKGIEVTSICPEDIYKCEMKRGHHRRVRIGVPVKKFGNAN